MSRPGRPATLLVLLVATLCGCGEEPRYLTLDVSAPEGAPPAFQLRIAVTLDGGTDLVLAPAEPAASPLSWPTDLSLELAAGTSGQLTIVVQAIGAGEETVLDAQVVTRAEVATRLEVALVACEGRIAGPTSIGTSWGLFAADKKFFNRVSLAEGGEVERLSLYAMGAGGSGEQVFRGVLYGSAADQEPATLVGASEETAIGAAAPTGWYELVLSPPVVVGPGAYWIGIHAGGPSPLFQDAYVIEPGTMRVGSDVYLDGPADPFGAATPADATMSLHLVYRGCL